MMKDKKKLKESENRELLQNSKNLFHNNCEEALRQAKSYLMRYLGGLENLQKDDETFKASMKKIHQETLQSFDNYLKDGERCR